MTRAGGSNETEIEKLLATINYGYTGDSLVERVRTLVLDFQKRGDLLEAALHKLRAGEPLKGAEPVPQMCPYDQAQCEAPGCRSPESPRFDPRCEGIARLRGEEAEREGGEAADPQESLLNPVLQVYFRAGLIACREYMARFVEPQDSGIAASIRANWWPQLGKDYGPPRQLDFGEMTTGEYGTPEFRCLTASEVSPTQEALPIALAFLGDPLDALPASPQE